MIVLCHDIHKEPFRVNRWHIPENSDFYLENAGSRWVVDTEEVRADPPKVEYALTPPGESLVAPLMHLYDCANTNMPEIKASRKRYEKAEIL